MYNDTGLKRRLQRRESACKFGHVREKPYFYTENVKEQKKDNINIDGFQKFLDTANVLPSDEETNKSESEKTVGLDIENPAQPCKSPVKWMDFAQFCDYNGYSLKKMMFFTYTKTIALISWFGVVGSILSCAIICGVILDSRDPAFEFWNNFTFVIFIISFVTALTFSILRKFSCQLNPKVLCDIQDNPSQFKLIRNKNGLIGISMWWNKRCKLLLRMVYDNILCINDDTFICIHNGSYGIYNATKKKMVVPVEYDSIEYKNGKIYASSRDGVVSVYTDTGYRVVE